MIKISKTINWRLKACKHASLNYFVPGSTDLRSVPAEKIECNLWPDADLDEKCLQKAEVTFCACKWHLVLAQTMGFECRGLEKKFQKQIIRGDCYLIAQE